MADAEGAISEVKLEGTLRRARCRGTPLSHVQVLVDFAAVNCKRLVRHAGVGVAIAGAPAAVASMGADSCSQGPPGDAASADQEANAHPSMAAPAIWSFSVCLN